MCRTDQANPFSLVFEVVFGHFFEAVVSWMDWTGVISWILNTATEEGGADSRVLNVDAAQRHKSDYCCFEAAPSSKKSTRACSANPNSLVSSFFTRRLLPLHVPSRARRTVVCRPLTCRTLLVFPRSVPPNLFRRSDRVQATPSRDLRLYRWHPRSSQSPNQTTMAVCLYVLPCCVFLFGYRSAQSSEAILRRLDAEASMIRLLGYLKPQEEQVVSFSVLYQRTGYVES